MMDYLIIIFAMIALIGAVSTYLRKSPFDKLIGIAVMTGGIIPFVVIKGYLDVAIVIALVVPVTTIFLLQATGSDAT
ncbi:hypothetical protein AZH53_02765 [Methanomicrobiaceae archaeon CYW5]|uniref:DUF2108 domain-containing protein n=1 Tax=Methanovulcanius yangii TaxID=1789227 RepID=UPI0029CA6EAB|nr:DUF2108 domain-containing protein [Methanovulcanius yangii]MBT8507352.1 hypothetical protein [Methanovulcanius yangii]